MSDLRCESAEEDKKTEPLPAGKRTILAFRLLVEEIPKLGKPLAALLWGNKSK